MLSTNAQKSQLKKRISTLKSSRRFISWGQSKYLARELEDLLQDIRKKVNDPATGAELIAYFYTTDHSVFDRCDDSSGTVGDVYRFSAAELFCDYARQCDDQKWLANLLLKIISKDDYGVRDSLLDHAAAFLAEKQIRLLIEKLQDQAEKLEDEYPKRSTLRQAAMLARQIKDPQLYEAIEIANWGTDLPLRFRLDIARVYLESKKPQTALERLLAHQGQDGNWEHDRDKLLLEIYQKLGDREKQIETAWRIFRFQRSQHSFSALIDLVGEEQKDKLLQEESAIIQKKNLLNITDLAFLIRMKQWDAAEHYILNRAEQLDGDNYNILPNLAADLETVARSLAATLIYRALLDSILRRAQTRTYGHGVRYLKKLELLADVIDDWQGFQPHSDYFDEIQKKHGRKTSFWGKYNR